MASEGMDLAQVAFPSVNNAGCVPVLTNAYSVPLPPGTQVQAKIHAAAWSSYGTPESVSPSMTGVIGRSSRFSILSITWMFWHASQAPSQALHRWLNGGRLVSGRPASISFGNR